MLDDRKSAILRAVVECHIRTAQPVSSAYVAQLGDLAVSPATVRNEMAYLEQEGYLYQPHASAGRVPTDKGYRFFVDSLPGRAALTPTQAELVRHVLCQDARRARRDAGRDQWPAVEADRLRRRRGGAGGTRARTGALSAAGESHGPNGAGRRRAGQRFGGETPARAAQRNLGRPGRTGLGQRSRVPGRRHSGQGGLLPPTGDPAADALAEAAVQALRTPEPDTASGHVFIGGAARMATAFEAVGTIRTVLGILEQQYVLVALLKDVLDRGLTVAIGAEHGLVPLADCSIVVAPYDVDGERAGTVGVLGPTRMHYDQTLAAVAVVSKKLSKALRDAGERRSTRDQGRPGNREAEELQPWLRKTITPSSASAAMPPRTRSSARTESWHASSTRTVTPARPSKPRPRRSVSSSSTGLTRP